MTDPEELLTTASTAARERLLGITAAADEDHA